MMRQGIEKQSNVPDVADSVMQCQELISEGWL